MKIAELGTQCADLSRDVFLLVTEIEKPEHQSRRVFLINARLDEIRRLVGVYAEEKGLKPFLEPTAKG